MHDKRVRELPSWGDMVISAPLLSLSVICVAVQDESGKNVDVLLDGVPLPMMVIPIPADTVIPVVQLQEPAGI